MLLAGLAGLLMLLQTTPIAAAEGKTAKERTIAGEAKCAMCMLHEGTKCQTVIQAKNKKGDKVTYYLVENDVAKALDDKVCHEAKKVTVTGTVKKVDGKNELTATKIASVK
jgi:Family of unknown function (DUF6370)